MAKTSGLGDNLYVAGNNLSGDVGSVDRISSPMAVLDVTGIDKSARERIGGLRDGGIDFTAFYNPTSAHPVLSALPMGDVLATYCRGTVLGNPTASCQAKQINYDGKRGNAGDFTLTVQTQSDGYGIEWGIQLTPGVRADTTPTAGTGIDRLAATAFGAQAYLHVMGVTGTSVTVTVEDSADGTTWAAVTGLVFTAATGVGWQRLATANTATIRRYVRATSSGTFTAASFAVALTRNYFAGQVF